LNRDASTQCGDSVHRPLRNGLGVVEGPVESYFLAVARLVS
jgi:hypothetical protein